VRGSEYLLRTLREQGIGHVFLVPGGHIDPLVADLGAGAGPIPVVAAHEEGAGFMADGYARAGGGFGACLAIGGPGAANLLPAAITALSDRSRVLFVTGDVPTTWQGRGAFQDGSMDGTRDDAYLRPATLYSAEVEAAGHLPRFLAAAFRAMCGLPHGPAHLSLPRDVQESAVGELPSGPHAPWEPVRPVDGAALARAAEGALAGAVKAAVLAGRGCAASGAADELRELAEAFELPVATTFAAKGILPADHRLALGMFGYAGTHQAIAALLEPDLDALLVLGSSLNLRDTLGWSRELGGQTRIVQVDSDPAMLGRNYPVTYGVAGDCREALRALRGMAGNVLRPLAATAAARRDWAATLKSGSRFYGAEDMASDDEPVHLARLVAEMRQVLPREAVLVIDSGAHRAFAGHYWDTFVPGGVLSATNLGPMGWAIPAGVGAKLARPDAPVIVLTGDGCMRMHGIEVATAARYRVPVLIVVSNNGALGNVWLRGRKDNAGAAEISALPDVDWAAFARALGAAGRRVGRPGELAAALDEGLRHGGPFVVDVATRRDCPTPVGPYAAMVAEYLHEHR
jgi:acetolactate synthase-1/2/3 large subunit